MKSHCVIHFKEIYFVACVLLSSDGNQMLVVHVIWLCLCSCRGFRDVYDCRWMPDHTMRQRVWSQLCERAVYLWAKGRMWVACKYLNSQLNDKGELNEQWSSERQVSAEFNLLNDLWAIASPWLHLLNVL